MKTDGKAGGEGGKMEGSTQVSELNIFASNWAIFFFFLQYWGFTFSHSTSPIFVKGFLNYLPQLALNCS
jgi:hypothetical protein